MKTANLERKMRLVVASKLSYGSNPQEVIDVIESQLLVKRLKSTKRCQWLEITTLVIERKKSII